MVIKAGNAEGFSLVSRRRTREGHTFHFHGLSKGSHAILAGWISYQPNRPGTFCCWYNVQWDP